MKNDKKTIFLELLLIISSVPIFRTIWELLDKSANIFNQDLVLYSSFILGIILCSTSLYYLAKK